MFENLKNKVLSDIIVNDDKTEILFITECGKKYIMYHRQECCESVSIEDITEDYKEILIGNKILMAEVSDHSKDNGDCDHETWTFYKLATIKGYVDIRWYGASNGYYSEAVDFKEFPIN